MVTSKKTAVAKTDESKKSAATSKTTPSKAAAKAKAPAAAVAAPEVVPAQAPSVAVAAPAPAPAPAPAAAPAPAPATVTPITPEQRMHDVQLEAYYIAERRGFAPGNPEEDWLAAEATVDRLIASGNFPQ